MNKDFKKSDLSVFISYIIPHRKLFAIDMLLSTLIAGIDLAFPFITRKAMNNLLPEKLYSAFFLVIRRWVVSWEAWRRPSV